MLWARMLPKYKKARQITGCGTKRIQDIQANLKLDSPFFFIIVLAFPACIFVQMRVSFLLKFSISFY